jgi:hypothetical protein
MSDLEGQETKQGFSMKLWRGERMCLIAFDVAEPEADLVGFAIADTFPTPSPPQTLIPPRVRAAAATKNVVWLPADISRW